MKKKTKIILGIILIVIGLLLLLSSFTSITGYIISGGHGEVSAPVLGISLIVIGVFYLLVRNH